MGFVMWSCLILTAITNTGSDGDGYCTYNSDNVCYIHCYSGGGVGIGNRYMCYHSLMGGGGRVQRSYFIPACGSQQRFEMM